MKPKTLTSICQSISASVLVLLISGTAAAQITTAKPPNPNITPLGPHRQEPPGGRPPNNAGDVEGFVYWDTSSVTHKQAGTCSGLAVNVSAAGSSNNPIQLGNHFTYAGQVKAFLYGGKQVVYDVCIYAYHGQPVGPPLQAQLVITQPSQFSPHVAAQVATISPITIINAQCNMLPPIVPATVGDLTSHWGSCQNRAYDVNFALVPSTHLLGSSEGSRGPLLKANQNTVNSGTTQSSSHGMLMGGTNPSPTQPPSGGMLTGGTNPGPQQSPPHGELVPAVKPVQSQGPSTKGAPGQLLPAAGAPTLTNADVIGLVKGGVPESAIINQIKSSNKQFDFSSTSCQALAQAHVSQNVLNAMGDGSVRPCFTGGVRTGAGNGADDLNPQPYPPKGTLLTPGSSANTVQLNPQPFPPKGKSVSKMTRSAAVALSAPKQSQKITNPNASLQDTAIIAVLQKQRETADAEATQMKLGIRPGAGVSSQPATTMSATGNASTLVSSAPAVSTAMTASPGTSSGNAASRYGKLQQGMTAGIAVTCGHDPTLRILTVSGGEGPATFTQDAKYNFYTITGCSFGDPGPNAKAYIYYQSTFHEDFQIEEWSNNWIKLHLDPKLTGIDDQNNLTLVIQRADGKQTSKGGYKFYAARDTTLLKQIPQRNFSLFKFRPDQSTIQNWKPTYTSGSSPNVVPNMAGLSAEVHWNLTPDPNDAIVGGKDIYDFSHLHSTFALSNALLEWKDLSCTDSSNNYQLASSKDNWNIDWYQSAGVQVSWPGEMCINTPGSCGGAFQSDCFVSPPESNYGIDVWVTGPRGVDPWTGKPI
ncbi:MAG TPA: hypothetical protein VJ731_06335 [Terriglobales bacterium]|nr:hypothetical protein [Terriglobales bacterium]